MLLRIGIIKSEISVQWIALVQVTVKNTLRTILS